MRLIFLAASVLMLAWSVYQLYRGEVYIRTRFNPFSKPVWVPKSTDGIKFWVAIISQFFCAAVIGWAALTVF